MFLAQIVPFVYSPIRVKSGFQRWNANFKLTQKINKKLTADFDLRYSEIEVNGTVCF